MHLEQGVLCFFEPLTLLYGSSSGQKRPFSARVEAVFKFS